MKFLQIALCFAVAASYAADGFAAEAAPTETAPARSVGTDTGRHARVAGGVRIALKDSTRNAAQWSARRPQARDLRPKPRGTFD